MPYRWHTGSRANSRRAFTLVELLVVLAIISILVGILLPAVQQVRESARRTQCQNNLRQLGLSLINFHDVNKVFPASGWTTAGPGNPQGKYVGWRALTLPYIEQENLQELYNFNVHWWEGTNPTAGGVPVRTYQCPSSPVETDVLSAVAKPPRPAMTFPVPLAPTDYEAIMGVKPESIDPVRYNASNRFCGDASQLTGPHRGHPRRHIPDDHGGRMCRSPAHVSAAITRPEYSERSGNRLGGQRRSLQSGRSQRGREPRRLHAGQRLRLRHEQAQRQRAL